MCSPSRARGAALSSDVAQASGFAANLERKPEACATSSPPRFFYSGELELGAARLLQQEMVAGDTYHINCCSEWRLNLNSILVAEFVPTTRVTQKNSTI